MGMVWNLFDRSHRFRFWAGGPDVREVDARAVLKAMLRARPVLRGLLRRLTTDADVWSIATAELIELVREVLKLEYLSDHSGNIPGVTDMETVLIFDRFLQHCKNTGLLVEQTNPQT